MSKFDFVLKAEQAERFVAYIGAHADNGRSTVEDWLGAIRVVGIEATIQHRQARGDEFHAWLETTPAAVFRWDGQKTKGRFVEVVVKDKDNFVVYGDFGERKVRDDYGNLPTTADGNPLPDDECEWEELTRSSFIEKAFEYAMTGIRNIPMPVGLTEGEINGIKSLMTEGSDTAGTAAVKRVRRVCVDAQLDDCVSDPPPAPAP